MTIGSFAKLLPYWAIRDLETTTGRMSTCFLVDGSAFCGFELTGFDASAYAAGELADVSMRIGKALNGLPADGFVQVEWVTGYSDRNLIAKYAGTVSSSASDMLRYQKQARARFMGKGETIKGRMNLYVGVKGLVTEVVKAKTKSNAKLITPETFKRVAKQLEAAQSAVVRELESAGLRCAPYDAEGLKNALYQAINPESQRERKREAEKDIVGTPIPKLEALALRDQLPLGDIVWSDSSFTLDEPPRLYRALTLHELPSASSANMYMPVQVAASSPMRLVHTFLCIDNEKIKASLKGRRLAARMTGQNSAGEKDEDAEFARNGIQDILWRMSHQGDRVFWFSSTAIVTGETIKDLDVVTDDVMSAYSSTGATATIEHGRQVDAWLGALPGYGYSATTRHQLSTANASDMFPMYQQEQGDVEHPQMLFHNQFNSIVAWGMKSKQRRDNNVTLVGNTGSGKSFLAQNIISNCTLAAGGPTIIIDVVGADADAGYKVLAEVLGGTYVSLSTEGGVSFNPFFSMDEIIVTRNGKKTVDEEKLLFLAQLVCLMCKVGDAELSFATNIATKVIADAYITRRKKGDKRPPLFRHVVDELREYKATEEEFIPIARRMYLELKTWIEHPKRKVLLDNYSSFQSDSKLQVFDFYGMDKDPELAEILIFSISFYAWSIIEKYPMDVVKQIVFDECWKMLTSPLAAHLLRELYKTGRKRRASTWSISQSAADFVNSPVGDAMISNSATIFLTPHGSGQRDVAAEVFGLTERGRSLFDAIELRKGSYGEVLRHDSVSGRSTVMQLRPTAFDLWLCTTDPDDLAFRGAVKTNLGLSMTDTIVACSRLFPSGAPSDKGLGLQKVKEALRA